MTPSCDDRLDPSIHRIAVVGTTGSGKSTLAGEIARRLHIPHVEMDALYWQPGWKESPQEVMRQRVEAFTAAGSWVTDGNYGFVRDLVWSRAQAAIWLDYPLALVLWRLWQRTWKRLLSREVLWGTNTERFWPQFFSTDSLFLYAIKSHRRHIQQYTQLFAQPESLHLRVYHFKSPAQVKAWLETLPPYTGNPANR